MSNAIKGRGAVNSPANRFDVFVRERDAVEDEQQSATAPRTVITLQQARSIISRNASPDVPFSQSINPYQGCEHGCVYCYARPSHAYLGLSPGLDFETKIFGKKNAAALLRAELSRPNYRCEVIALGANTDPYQPLERDHGITREILQVLAEFRHPVGIITKSSLVERDIDLLADMAKDNLACVHVSITSLDADLSRKLEPRAAAPFRRLETVGRLSAAGIPCGVLVAPVIPFVTDQYIEKIIAESAKAGARSAGYVMLRLPYELKDVFKHWLHAHFPLRAAHVMARIKDIRGGRENDPNFGSRMSGEGEYAELIRRRFDAACRRAGLNNDERDSLSVNHFKISSVGTQIDLF